MDSIVKNDIESKLLETLGKSLEEKGYRIVDLDCHVAGSAAVRVFIERIADGKVSLEDCTIVARELSPQLDALDFFPGPYQLEVSSPGLDRRLRLAPDFEKALGKELKLGLVEKIEGVGANVRGTLLGVDPGSLRMKVSGKEVGIPLSKVKKANAIWTPGASASEI